MNSTNLDSLIDNLPSTPEDECSYFSERLSKVKFTVLTEKNFTPSVVEEFTNRGFRRSGNFLYTTVCNRCRLCIPYRIPLKELRFTTSQKRNLKNNSSIRLEVTNPNPTSQKEDIYLRYIKSVHNENIQNEDDWDILDTMYSQMYSFTKSSWELEYYDGQRLMGFGIVDVGTESISAVYNVYDPEYRSSGAGTFMIAKSMDWVLSENLFSYYHLGLYIPNHPKMDYKRKFGPGEILHPLRNEWVKASEIL